MRSHHHGQFSERREIRRDLSAKKIQLRALEIDLANLSPRTSPPLRHAIETKIASLRCDIQQAAEHAKARELRVQKRTEEREARDQQRAEARAKRDEERANLKRHFSGAPVAA